MGEIAMSTAPELPSLPDPDDFDSRWTVRHIYTADQMRAYGAACAAAEREACARVCDERVHADKCAAAIRARNVR